jgi:hypothetical protein
MLAVAAPMRRAGTDIVPFELAGDAASVDRIIGEWGPEGVRAAKAQTWMDMAYLSLYATATSSACATIATAARGNDRPALAATADALGWAAVVAAGCDAIENAAMLAELSGARGRLPAIARRCALVKFGLITPAALYALGGLAVLGVARLRSA